MLKVKNKITELRFNTKQALGNKLDAITCSDLKSTGYERNDLIHPKFHEYVGRWWKQDVQVKFLTENCDIFDTVVNEVNTEKNQSISLKKIRNNFVKFRRAEFHEEINGMNINSDTPELSCVKVKQYFDFYNTDSQLIDTGTLQNVTKDENIILQSTGLPNFVDINRVLLDNSHTQTVSKSISEIKGELVILAVESRMGKSFLLARLTNSIEKKKSAAWIVSINFLDHSKKLYQWSETKTSSEKNLCNDLFK